MRNTVLLLSISAILLGCGGDNDTVDVVTSLPNPTTPSDPSQDANQPPVNPNSPSDPSQDSDQPPITPSLPAILQPGIYTGITGQDELAEGLIDDDKRLWVIYYDNKPDDYPLGIINSNQGITTNDGQFSVKGKNYSYEAKNDFDITIEGNYQTAKKITGEIFDVPSRSTTYTIDYDETLSAKKQRLSSINNKTFTGPSYITGDTDASKLILDFSNNGLFLGQDESGCSLTGQLTLSESQRYFDTTVTFDSDPCIAANQTITGVALIGDDNELIVLGTDTNRNRGIYFNSE